MDKGSKGSDTAQTHIGDFGEGAEVAQSEKGSMRAKRHHKHTGKRTILV